MASILSKIWAKLNSRRSSSSIMLIGLDNSGKSSILSCVAKGFKSTKQQTRQQPTNSQTRTITNQPKHFEQVDSTNPEQSMLDFGQRTFADILETTTFRAASSDAINIIEPTIGYDYDQFNFRGLNLIVLDFSGQNRYRCLWQEFFSCVDAIVFVIDSSDLLRFVVAKDELECVLNHVYFTSLANKSHNQPLGNQPNILRPPEALEQSATSLLTVQKQLSISQGKLIQSPLIYNKTRTNITSRKSPSARDQRTDQEAVRVKVPILFLANKCDLPNSVDIEVIIKALDLNKMSTERHPWCIQATSVLSGQGIQEAFSWLFDQLANSA